MSRDRSLGFSVNLVWNAISQNLVLFFQELDVLRQFVGCRRRDQSQQWVENRGGRLVSAQNPRRRQTSMWPMRD